MRTTPRCSPRRARLGAFAVVLALALGGGAARRRRVRAGARRLDRRRARRRRARRRSRTAELPGGLAISRRWLHARAAHTGRGRRRPARSPSTIAGPDGRPVTDFDVEHDKELHLVVVSRDLAGYAHVHPARDADGRWTVDAPAAAARLVPGVRRLRPAGGRRAHPRRRPHRPRRASTRSPSPARRRGDRRRLRRHLRRRARRRDRVRADRHRHPDGEPVTDLEPYLGALGHLVAIRDGDLAYLHVHPRRRRRPAAVGRFTVEVPTRRHLRTVLRLLPRRRGPHRGLHRRRRPRRGDPAATGGAPADHDEHGG